MTGGGEGGGFDVRDDLDEGMGIPPPPLPAAPPPDPDGRVEGGHAFLPEPVPAQERAHVDRERGKALSHWSEPDLGPPNGRQIGGFTPEPMNAGVSVPHEADRSGSICRRDTGR
jgi:hypothetical protein